MEQRIMLVLRHRILCTKVAVHLACIKQEFEKGIELITKVDVEKIINKYERIKNATKSI